MSATQKRQSRYEKKINFGGVRHTPLDIDFSPPRGGEY